MRNGLSRWPIGLLLAVLAGTVGAADVAEYHARVEAALANVSELRSLEEASESSSDLDSRLISEIRRNVPASETIDLPASSVETSNEWLHQSLDVIESTDDRESRLTQINALEERLSTIDQQLTQLQNAGRTDGSKDEHKRKIAEILRRQEYQPPQEKGESLFQQWVRRFSDWLASVFPRVPAFSESSPGAGNLTMVLQIVVVVLLIALLGFLVYKIAPMISYRFGRKEKRVKGDRVILGERIAENISGKDLFGEAEGLAREGNVREAIRKGYIALLCELGDRKLVRLARHKTNRDYLRDVKVDPALHKHMIGLTGSYEQNWYGLRSVGVEEWDEFRARYHATVGKDGNK